MNKILISALFLILIVGCQDNDDVDCSQSDLSFTTTVVDAHCSANGSIDISATGGEAPYLYFIDDGSGKTEATELIDRLLAGDYLVEVKDNLGCNFELYVTVDNINNLNAISTVTKSDCGLENGSIEITASGGIEPYQYQLDSNTPQTSSAFSVGAGLYSITVADANGCEYILLEEVLTNVTYTSDIEPILANSCATTGCHDGSGSLPNFSNLSEVQSNASSIKTRTQNGTMPPTGSLTDAQKALIACWVDDGAPNN